MISLAHFLTVAAILFVLGVLGIFLNRRNVILILMAIELILLAVNINLVAFCAYLGDMVGLVFALFVMSVAAGGAACGRPPDRGSSRPPQARKASPRSRRLPRTSC